MSTTETLTEAYINYFENSVHDADPSLDYLAEKVCAAARQSLEAKGAWEQQTLNDLWHHFFRLEDAKACSQVFCYAKDKGLHVGPAPSTGAGEQAGSPPNEPLAFVQCSPSSVEGASERTTESLPIPQGRDAAEGEYRNLAMPGRMPTPEWCYAQERKARQEAWDILEGRPNVSPHEQESLCESSREGPATDAKIATPPSQGPSERSATKLGRRSSDASGGTRSFSVAGVEPGLSRPTDRETISELAKTATHMAHNLSINRHGLGSGVESVLLKLASALTRLIDERDFFKSQLAVRIKNELLDHDIIAALQSRLAAAERKLAYTKKCNKTLRACIRGEIDPIDQLVAAKEDNERLTKAVIEERAKLIYERMPYEAYSPGDTKPEWVEHGNSLKQDEARKQARAALQAGSQR